MGFDTFCKFNSRESRISKVVRGYFVDVVYFCKIRDINCKKIPFYFCEILSQPYFKETYLFPPIIFSHISNSKKMEIISTLYMLGVRDHKNYFFAYKCLTLLVNIKFSAKMSANKLIRAIHKLRFKNLCFSFAMSTCG